MKPIFLLGVGAQKSGTTWLYETLNSQKNINFGLTKEYHIWDAKFHPLGKLFLVKESVDSELNNLRKSMQTREGFYEDYFYSLINKKINITGDITPSYSLLDEDNFKTIKEKIEKKGFEIKVIFLMRNPVYRAWSAIRMNRRNQEKKGKIISDDEFLKNFLKKIRVERTFERGRYDKTITSLEKVFDQKQIHYEFYERLFSYSAMESLASFIECSVINYDFSNFINSSKSLILPDNLKKDAMFFFSDVYKFCFDKFPITKTLWK